jgi:hypothetical protein
LDRPVALKVLLHELVSTPESLARFTNEARIMARLRHPSIVSVLDHDVEDGIPWIAFEYVPGISLRTQLGTGRLPWPEVVAIGIAMASALEVTHEKGILHRDIKPENIIAKDDGSWKLTDFGIAHWADATNVQTAEGTILGTPQYFSPQQLMGHPVDPRSDLYSLGITLYELATGVIPFWEETLVVSLQKRLNDPLPRASSLVSEIPTAVDEVLRRLLSAERDHCFETASELREALTELSAAPRVHGPTVAIRVEPKQVPSRSRGSGRHNRSSSPTVRLEHPPPALRPVRWRLVAGTLAAVALSFALGQRLSGTAPVERASAPAVLASAVRVGAEYKAIEKGLSGLINRVRARIQDLIGAGVERGFDEKAETEMRRLVAEMRADRLEGLKLERRLGDTVAVDGAGACHLALRAIASGYQVQSVTGALQLVRSVQASQAIGFSPFSLQLNPDETPATVIGNLEKAVDLALRALVAPWDCREQSTLELLYESMTVVSMRAHDVDWARSAEPQRRRLVETFEAQLDATPANGSSPWVRLGACAWRSGPHRTSPKYLVGIHAVAHQVLDSFATRPESTGWNLQSLRSRFKK